MKKRILALVLACVTALSLAACGSAEASTESVLEESVSEAKTFNVYFKDGLKKIGSVEGTEGVLVTGYEDFEVKDGYEFVGWYETPSFLEASKRDLTVDTFSEMTTLYGCWKSLTATEDTREFYIVGEGSSPVLKNSAWAGSDVSEENKNACKFERTENTNEYVITVDLFKDDKFQIISDWQWDGQYGFGKVTDYDPSQFESGGGLSGESSKANISVLMDGNYTITMVTDVDTPAFDTISIVRNSDPLGEALESADATFVAGDNTSVVMKGSWVADWSENIPLEATGEGHRYTITKEFDAGTELYFMIWDNDADTGIGMKYSSVDDASKALLEEADNVKLKDAGTYTIVADVDNMTLTITK